MAPRSGGEADKVGNRYEAAWTVRHALYCILAPGRSVTPEDIDPGAGQGSEFTYLSGGVTEVHQLKRQHGNKNYWSIKALDGLGIFKSAAAHVAAGRVYRFSSLIPCGPLKELAERARKSADLETFTQSWLTQETRTAFDELAAPEVLGSAQAAWTALRGMWFEVHDEDDVTRVNAMLAERSLEGATGHVISLAIGDILLDNLGKTVTGVELLEGLAAHGIARRSVGSHASAHDQIVAVADSWVATVRRELLEPPIERLEVEQIVNLLVSDRLGLVVGTAGGGKSAVLERTVSSLRASGGEVLAFRLDRLEPFASTVELGRQLGLETSPAAALALAADGGEAYLVIDQLDAVSLASGRMPQSFDVVMDLIGEALSIAEVRVVLACREFDVENDHRIRALATRSDMRKIPVNELSSAAVKAAVASMGLEPAHLSGTQLTLLQTPLHLVLLRTIADQGDALSFQSRGALFAAFWERKRQAAKARRAVRFNDVLTRVANAASDRQVLYVPIEVLDEGDLIDDANVLVSEHVLARDGGRIAFFHETFFDYAFARQWISREESLVEFLLRDEQELFRRGQVRQILQHLHEREPERFAQELEGLLTRADIRFHIRETAMAVFANLLKPTTEEADLALRVAATTPSIEGQLWQQLRRQQWFYRFNTDGHIAAWLDSRDEQLQARALNFMASGASAHGNDVAALLEARVTNPRWADWMRSTARFAELHKNRRLFDLLLAAVRAGAYDAVEHELWLTVHDLAKHQPCWAVELLQARLIDHVSALVLNDERRVAVLTTREYGAAKLVRQTSTTEPLAFVETIVPYLLNVMSATEHQGRVDRLVADKHFTYRRLPEDDFEDRKLDDALLRATVRALQALARTEPEAIRPILETLADDPHDAAQFLLYRALAAGGQTYADWAAELLAQGGTRLRCGYLSDAKWVARELVRAIGPYISDEAHQQLEDTFRDLRNPYEQRQSSGRLAFTFLSALDESRLSEFGARRLGELRRKFRAETPPAPQGVVGGVVVSPIGDTAAGKMTDAQWLGAWARYDNDDHDWDTLKGGARELSHQLQSLVAADPNRFSRLALQLTPELNTAYGDAVLMGLGEATTADPDAVFAAIRHIASLGHAENDRWLGMALRRRYREAPMDIVQLVLDRALNSTDPVDDSPVFSRDGEDRPAANLRTHGINTARGSLAEALGDLLVYDSDGERTASVIPHLEQLANDPILSVRSCVAHTVAACLRHARPEAIAAFQQLIDADDALLASDLIQQLMLYIGNVNPEVLEPVVRRMLTSENFETREAGGRIAAFAALEWQRPEFMDQALSCDARVRQGVADVCSQRIDRTSNAELATTALLRLMYDEDDEVRKAAAQIASHLCGQPLRPFAALLESLIQSPSYEHATAQLLLALEDAPDKVDDLALRARADRRGLVGPSLGPFEEFDGEDQGHGQGDLAEALNLEAVGVAA